MITTHTSAISRLLCRGLRHRPFTNDGMNDDGKLDGYAPDGDADNDDATDDTDGPVKPAKLYSIIHSTIHPPYQ
jgi:hypothetical protein